MERLFYPLIFAHALRRVEELKARKVNLSHYTSAEVAISILQKKEIWLRNAAVMNDFHEVEHGLKCLMAMFNDPYVGPRFESIVNSVSPGLYEMLYDRYNNPVDLYDTYLACLSEHGEDGGAPSEDELGRLSMWRAYGGNTNVALILDSRRVLDAPNGLVYLSPVLYADVNGFRKEFEAVCGAMDANIKLFKQDERAFFVCLVSALDAAVLSTKHPGFAEEREWRLIYRPNAGGNVPCRVFSVGGVPQKVYLLKLDGHNNVPDLDSVLDHVLIGPTQFPTIIEGAINQVLSDNKYRIVDRRVRVSNIPLRR
ncbi:DUF2971 domain-containing protein [Cereibacter sphaeroides]|jgi:hypothetical protein|uniref:DUF2971 domain-containing protein n=1 Tax=Cereibacter sphaeroides TaxID=1063 RepID=UPI0000F29935|nr:hypothetical protein Rsph17029_2026 [Cereibacter sphaeroides ATCC 17029]